MFLPKWFIASAPLVAYLETGRGCAEPWSQAQNPQTGCPSLQPLGWVKKERFLLKEDGSYLTFAIYQLYQEVHGELFHQGGGGGGKIWETTEEKNLSSFINAKWLEYLRLGAGQYTSDSGFQA